MSSLKKKFYCSNPLKLSGHDWYDRNLRVVQGWMIDIAPNLKKDDRICASCRQKLAKKRKILADSLDFMSDEELPNKDVEESNLSKSDEVSIIEEAEALAGLNISLESLGESPIAVRKISTQKKYPSSKFRKISSLFKRRLFGLKEAGTTGDSDDDDDGNDEKSEIILQLKEKYDASIVRSEKIVILTLLPKSWTVKKVQRVFNCTNYAARQAKQLQKDKGIMSSPNLKIGKKLNTDTEAEIIKFYESVSVSRILPGRKDFKSVRIEGKKVQLQKRLILCNLREAHTKFKSDFPQHHVGFSKFCALRPAHCVLPGASGTHSVCVCVMHQNLKLMLIGGGLAELTKNFDVPLKSLRDTLTKIICNPPDIRCFFKECDECPGPDDLITSLETIFEENSIDEVQYKQWVHTDRSNLETVTQSSDEFLESFSNKLPDLLRHSFTATQQSAFYSELKEALNDGEFLVICDFSENFAFVLQDAAQGFHWNNAQATIHPFVAYYKVVDKTKNTSEVRHKSYVVISDSLIHDSVAVHLHIKHFIEFLKSSFDSVQKIYYFSDGAGSHYKNRKSFYNLCQHSSDFDVQAEWHFFATSHGKSPCDGLGGTVKRLAVKASLQKPYNDQIMTPRQLFVWAKENIRSINFEYIPKSAHVIENEEMQERFKLCKRIPGTRKFHAFIPESETTLTAKLFSRAASGVKATVIKKPDEPDEPDDLDEENGLDEPSEQNLEIDDIKGFVICMYDKKWWLACVLQTFSVTEEVKMTFLHPHGPNPSFVYPEKPDILSLPVHDILMLTDPQTVTGRTYKIPDLDMHRASSKLEKRT